MSGNESIWMTVKSPFGDEQYVPRIVDINAGGVQQDERDLRPLRYPFYLLTLASLLILAGLVTTAILIPILFIPPNSTLIVLTTPAATCFYPSVLSELNTCVNLMIDSSNCGKLNNVCPANSSCSAGHCSSVPGILLDRPIAVWSAATNGSVDDQMYEVALPWPITLYNMTRDQVIVTSDGVLCLGRCATSYTESSLPASRFPDATAFPFWDDLYVYSNTSQGIYYQSDGVAPNRILTFEYYLSHYIDPNQFYHFQVIFFENAPGIVQYKYFQASDHGDTCTIGAQASNLGPFVMYSYDQANAVQNNLLLTFDTNRGTFNRTMFT